MFCHKIELLMDPKDVFYHVLQYRRDKKQINRKLLHLEVFCLNSFSMRSYLIASEALRLCVANETPSTFMYGMVYLKQKLCFKYNCIWTLR